jgi:hypothetical protein
MVMNIKSLILICLSFLCMVSLVAVAQSTYAPNDCVGIQSPNQHVSVYGTQNTDMVISNSQLSQVGQSYVEPMASTTYDQQPSIANRRNAGDNPFGDGQLPSNPKEPGVPVGDMPLALLLILAAGYAVFRVVSNANARKRSRVR